MEGIHKYTARYFYTEATFTCYFVSQNQYIFIFGKLILWNLQLNNFKTTFSSRFDELRGDFCFSKNFFKNTPPRFLSHFKQVKGLLIFFSKHPHFFASRFKQVKGYKNFLKSGDFGCAFRHPLSKWVKGVFSMARLSKRLKQEWDFFISPKTGRRTYNDLCRKCRNDCKQSFRAIVVSCLLYCSKRSVKSVPNGNDFNDSG